MTCDLMAAIDSAAIVLSLLKLKEEEVPERRIWGHREKLAEHLEMIKRQRANPDEKPIEEEPLEDAEMDRNDLVDEYLKLAKE